MSRCVCFLVVTARYAFTRKMLIWFANPILVLREELDWFDCLVGVIFGSIYFLNYACLCILEFRYPIMHATLLATRTFIYCSDAYL